MIRKATQTNVQTHAKVTTVSLFYFCCSSPILLFTCISNGCVLQHELFPTKIFTDFTFKMIRGETGACSFMFSQGHHLFVQIMYEEQPAAVENVFL